MRLFLSISPPKEWISELLKIQKKFSNTKKIRWVKPENFHITVYFFGNVEEKILPEINSILENLYQNTKSFTLEPDKILWKANQNEHMLWLQLKPSHDFNWVTENTFKKINEFSNQKNKHKQIPHITIARSKTNQSIIPITNSKLLPFSANSIDLVQSVLTKSGPFYTKIQTFLLK